MISRPDPVQEVNILVGLIEETLHTEEQSMYQNLTIIGNLGREPELSYVASGDAVCRFSVATSRKWGGDNPGEETTWFNVSVWGRQAEACNQFLSKGRQVFVEGTLTPDRETGGPRIWQDSNGKARASFEMRAFNVKFLGNKNDSASEGYSSPKEEAPSIDTDEIPF